MSLSNPIWRYCRTYTILKRDIRACDSCRRDIRIRPSIVALSSHFGPQANGQSAIDATQLVRIHGHARSGGRARLSNTRDDLLNRAVPLAAVRFAHRAGRCDAALQSVRRIVSLPNAPHHCRQSLKRFPYDAPPAKLPLRTTIMHGEQRSGVGCDALAGRLFRGPYPQTRSP